MKKFILLLLLLVSGVLFADAAGRKSVAVYVQGKHLSEDDKSLVSSAMLARISSNPNYIPYERDDDFLDALTREHDFQLSGEVSEREIRAIGRMCGVDYVIVVKVSFPTCDECNMAARLVNIETGRVHKSDNYSRRYDGSYSRVLIPMANYITHRMFNQQ